MGEDERAVAAVRRWANEEAAEGRYMAGRYMARRF